MKKNVEPIDVILACVLYVTLVATVALTIKYCG